MAVTELKADQISIQRKTNPDDTILIKRLVREIKELKIEIGEMDIK
jgi:hypothetical protein